MLAAVATAALLVAGCGDDEDDSGGTTEPQLEVPTGTAESTTTPAGKQTTVIEQGTGKTSAPEDGPVNNDNKGEPGNPIPAERQEEFEELADCIRAAKGDVKKIQRCAQQAER